jgi:restriction system protein
MGKNNRQSIFESLIYLPWYILVILTIIVFISPTLLTEYLNWQYNQGNSYNFIIYKLFNLWTPVSKLISLLLLIFSIFSYLNRNKRNKLFNNQKDLETLYQISWKEFEMLVGETFYRMGYKVKPRGGANPDGGVDLEAYKDGLKTIIQCKHWKKQSVGVSVVREMFAVGVHEGANNVYIITCGYFSKDAKEFAKDKAIYLISGYQLLKWIKQLQENT